MKKKYKIQIYSTIGQKKILQEQVEKMFKRIFLKNLMSFQHFYLENPYGSIIIAAFDNFNNLIGMGHAIFLKDFISNNQKYKFLHFTTSMIDHQYRTTRLYFDILDTLKEQARFFEADFILAFPNSNALPILTTLGGFKKLNQLHWIKFEHIPKNLKCEDFIFPDSFLFWRLSRFRYFYTKKDNFFIIYKKYGELIDILHITQQDFCKKTLHEQTIRDNQILISSYHLSNNAEKSHYESVHTNQVVYYPILNTIDTKSFGPIFSDVF